MPAFSAGVLMYRWTKDGLQVLLVHPGGPYWRKKDDGAWSIPKGEMESGDVPDQVARREFEEELGVPLVGSLAPLGEIRQKAGKRVLAFAVEGDFDASTTRSNTFDMEWPPKSGQISTFPEVDRAEWFGLTPARSKLLAGQVPFLDRLKELLGRDGASA